jgi:hypothetical protein
MVGSVPEPGLKRQTRVPHRLPEDTAQAGQAKSIGQLDHLTVDIAISQLTAPDMLPVLVGISIVIAMNEPELLGIDRSKFDMQGPLRLQIPQQNHRHRLQSRRRLHNVTELAMRITAEEDAILIRIRVLHLSFFIFWK